MLVLQLALRNLFGIWPPGVELYVSASRLRQVGQGRSVIQVFSIGVVSFLSWKRSAFHAKEKAAVLPAFLVAFREHSPGDCFASPFDQVVLGSDRHVQHFQTTEILVYLFDAGFEGFQLHRLRLVGLLAGDALSHHGVGDALDHGSALEFPLFLLGESHGRSPVDGELVHGIQKLLDLGIEILERLVDDRLILPRPRQVGDRRIQSSFSSLVSDDQVGHVFGRKCLSRFRMLPADQVQKRVHELLVVSHAALRLRGNELLPQGLLVGLEVDSLNSWQYLQKLGE